MKKIGILGGTFDPLHIGHLILAENAYEEFGLDEVWLMPSAMPPHKSDKRVTGAQYRSGMIKLSIAGNRHLHYSGFELERQGYTYTADTLKRLKEEYPETEFYFILGEDSIDTFDKWRMSEVIVTLSKLVVAVRGEPQYFREKMEAFNKRYHCQAQILHTPLMAISSSEIRKRVSQGHTIRYMVHPDVEQYIYRNGLYRDYEE